MFSSLKKGQQNCLTPPISPNPSGRSLLRLDDQYCTLEIHCKVSYFWFCHLVKMRLLLNISTCHLFMCNVVTAQQHRVEERREQFWWLQCDEIFSEIITGVRRILSHPRRRERKEKENVPISGETQLDPHDVERTLFTYSNYLELFRLHERLSMQTDWVQTWVGLI